MSVRFCRACLQMNGRLEDMSPVDARMYQSVVGLMVNENQIISSTSCLCVECSALMKKAFLFRRKAKRAHHKILEIASSNCDLHEVISNVDRKRLGLVSNLDVSCTLGVINISPKDNNNIKITETENVIAIDVQTIDKEESDHNEDSSENSRIIENVTVKTVDIITNEELNIDNVTSEHLNIDNASNQQFCNEGMMTRKKGRDRITTADIIANKRLSVDKTTSDIDNITNQQLSNEGAIIQKMERDRKIHEAQRMKRLADKPFNIFGTEEVVNIYKNKQLSLDSIANQLWNDGVMTRKRGRDRKRENQRRREARRKKRLADKPFYIIGKEKVVKVQTVKAQNINKATEIGKNKNDGDKKTKENNATDKDNHFDESNKLELKPIRSKRIRKINENIGAEYKQKVTEKLDSDSEEFLPEESDESESDNSDLTNASEEIPVKRVKKNKTSTLQNENYKEMRNAVKNTCKELRRKLVPIELLLKGESERTKRLHDKVPVNNLEKSVSSNKEKITSLKNSKNIFVNNEEYVVLSSPVQATTPSSNVACEALPSINVAQEVNDVEEVSILQRGTPSPSVGQEVTPSVNIVKKGRPVSKFRPTFIRGRKININREKRPSPNVVQKDTLSTSGVKKGRPISKFRPKSIRGSTKVFRKTKDYESITYWTNSLRNKIKIMPTYVVKDTKVTKNKGKVTNVIDGAKKSHSEVTETNGAVSNVIDIDKESNTEVTETNGTVTNVIDIDKESNTEVTESNGAISNVIDIDKESNTEVTETNGTVTNVIDIDKESNTEVTETNGTVINVIDKESSAIDGTKKTEATKPLYFLSSKKAIYLGANHIFIKTKVLKKLKNYNAIAQDGDKRIIDPKKETNCTFSNSKKTNAGNKSMEYFITIDGKIEKASHVKEIKKPSVIVGNNVEVNTKTTGGDENYIKDMAGGNNDILSEATEIKLIDENSNDTSAVDDTNEDLSNQETEQDIEIDLNDVFKGLKDPSASELESAEEEENKECGKNNESDNEGEPNSQENTSKIFQKAHILAMTNVNYLSKEEQWKNAIDMLKANPEAILLDIQLKRNIYKCMECREIFKTALDLQMHIMQKRNQKVQGYMFYCDACSFRVQSEEDLNRHCMEEHWYEYTCIYCSKKHYTLNSLKRCYGKSKSGVRLAEKRRKFKIYVQTTPLTEEEKYKYTGPTGLLKCSLCDARFNTKREVTRHEEYHRVDKEKDKKLRFCNICKQKFIFTTGLHYHVESTHTYKYTCTLCGTVTYGLRASSHHTRKCKAKPQGDYCSLCNQYITGKNVRDHIAYDHPTSCNMCGESAVDKKKLYEHQFTVHGYVRLNTVAELNDPNYYCNACKVYFVDEKAYFAHLCRKHIEDAKNYNNGCFLCHKSFGNDEELTSHICTPIQVVEERLVQTVDCSFCQTKLATIREHIEHCFENHSNLPYNFEYDPESWTLCERCGKKVPKLNFKMHAKTHGKVPYKKLGCKYCKERYEYCSHIEHILTSHSDRPYLCQLCPEKFQRRFECRDHILKVHTPALPYKCEVCDSQFAHLDYLNDHLIEIHYLQPKFTDSAAILSKNMIGKIFIYPHMKIDATIVPLEFIEITDTYRCDFMEEHCEEIDYKECFYFEPGVTPVRQTKQEYRTSEESREKDIRRRKILSHKNFCEFLQHYVENDDFAGFHKFLRRYVYKNNINYIKKCLNWKDNFDIGFGDYGTRKYTRRSVNISNTERGKNPLESHKDKLKMKTNKGNKNNKNKKYLTDTSDSAESTNANDAYSLHNIQNINADLKQTENYVNANDNKEQNIITDHTYETKVKNIIEEATCYDNIYLVDDFTKKHDQHYRLAYNAENDSENAQIYDKNHVKSDDTVVKMDTSDIEETQNDTEDLKGELLIVKGETYVLVKGLLYKLQNTQDGLVLVNDLVNPRS